MLARNAGRIEVAASCPQSEKRLASPMPNTPRVTQLFEELDTLAGSLMTEGNSEDEASIAPRALDTTFGEEKASLHRRLG